MVYCIFFFMKIILSFIVVATIGVVSLFYIKGKMNSVKNDDARILGAIEQEASESGEAENSENLNASSNQASQEGSQMDDANTQKAISYNLNDLPASPATAETTANATDKAFETKQAEGLQHSAIANSTEAQIDVEGVKKILKSVRQYDVINLLRVQGRGQSSDDKFKNIVFSDYFIVLSSKDVISSNKYQTITIAPALSKANYEKSSQKASFIKVNLASGEGFYVIPSSMRAVPKISVAKYYDSVTPESADMLQKETKNLI